MKKAYVISVVWKKQDNRIKSALSIAVVLASSFDEAKSLIPASLGNEHFLVAEYDTQEEARLLYYKDNNCVVV